MTYDNDNMPLNSDPNEVAEAHGIKRAAPTTQTKGRARQEVSVVIQEELSIAGVTESSFVALKEEAAALATLDPKSDADVAALQRVITKGNGLKSTISDAIEPGKKWAHALHRAYTGNENEFLGTVDAIIDPLKAKKAAYVARKEQAAQEELEAQEAAIRARLVAVEQYGFTKRTGTEGAADYYTNGATTIEMYTITMSDDTVWGNVIRGVEMAWNEAQAQMAEQERLVLEEAQRLFDQQQQMAERERKFKEQQDAFNAKINEARKNELMAMGFGMSEDGTHVECLVPLPPPRTKKASYEIALLHELGDALWQEELSVAKLVIDERYAALEEIAEAEARRKEQAAREALIAERVKALKEAGWVEAPHPQSQEAQIGLSEGGGPFTVVIVVDGLASMDSDEFRQCVAQGQAELARRKKVADEAIAQAAVEKERLRVQQEAEHAAEEERQRAGELDDAGRIEELAKAVVVTSALLAETLSLCKSNIAKQGIRKAIEHLGNAGSVLAGTLKDLK